jgi:hypothetical protein
MLNQCKGICQNYSDRCLTLPESCLILKEFHNAGGGSSGPVRKLLTCPENA